jgi:hypothetical protein
MADRTVAATDTLNYFRHEFNGTAEDVGAIADILSASSYIASSTDVVEAIVAINSELPEITTDAFVFPAASMVWEGATDDAYETTLAFTDPTADRTWTFPDGSGGVMLTDSTDTSSNKTFTSPVINGGTFSGSFTGSMDITGTVLSGASPFVFEGATDDSYETTLAITDPTADRVLTMPNATDTMIGKATTDTLSNKSFDFGGSGNSVTGSLAEWNAALQGDSFATLTGSETLSNKTFTNPTINDGVFSGSFTGTMNISGTVLSGASPLVFEGATDDGYETTWAFTDPTADRVITIPNATDTLIGKATTDTLTNKTIDLGSNTLTASLSEFNSALQSDSFMTLADTQTLTNKTFTAPTATSPVLNTAISGSAVKDEDNMSSNSATAVATQQSIKAYIDAQTLAHDLDIAPDSGSAQSIVLDNETLTFSGGTAIGTVASGNTVTMNIDSTVTTLTGSQTLTNKTFTAPTISAYTFSSGTSTAGLQIGASGIVFEGSTADGYETTLTVANPTTDRTITIPNESGTIVTTATHASKSNHIQRIIALGGSAPSSMSSF